ncbi:uncharacterized protein AB675_6850 [Cyphellophora attinorum]|uniref:Kinetochore protein fta4 n=1 Tax=Cyphellophora attinorum TaxID=1664694 RepID=A0A0N0NPX5_9EURO|nr:uncharacterized protein AB675_6850 [Phialophora attinorum]KPI43238.1 hypothetical protein AB675_6850 [Phialophora attinorum]
MPSTTSSPSISSQKLAFLNQQTRLLQTPLTTTQLPDPTQLPPKVLDKAIKDTNAKLATHNRTHFSAQAQQHVAEQIETLYWNRVHEERDLLLQQQGADGEGALGAETAIRRDISLLVEDVEDVQRLLPQRWKDVVLRDAGDSEEEIEQQDDGDEDAAAFEKLRAQLLTLTQQRRDAQQRLKRYKHLQDLLRPYEDAQEHIQPNLVTRDGELAREMEKLRSLLVRVGARMGQHGGATGHRERPEEEEQPQALSFDRRLDVLMGGD